MHDSSSSLPTLFAERGQAVTARAGQPLLLDGAGQAWWVAAGAVDLFLSRLEAGEPVGALHPLGRREAGRSLWGLPGQRPARDWGLVALGNSNCRLLALDPALQAEAWPAPARARELEDWLAFLLQPLAGLPPEAGVPLGETAPDAVEAGAILLGREQLWVDLEQGEWHYLGDPDLSLPPGPVPLPRQAWLQAGEGSVPARLRVCSGLPQAVRLESGCQVLAAGLWSALVRQLEQGLAAEDARLQQKEVREAGHLGEALGRLAAILDGGAGPGQASRSAGSASPLLAACRRLGEAAEIQFMAPAAGGPAGPRDQLAEIVEASRVRRRRVALRGAWWQGDGLPLLAFRREDGRPQALLPGPRGYRLADPDGSPPRLLDGEMAAQLEDFAWAFYRSFGDRLLGVVEMLRFGSRGCLRDYLMVLLMGVAIGLLGMVTPLATGMLFDTVIPGADKNQLLQLSLALLAGTLAASMFEMTRGFAMLRAEGRMDGAIQSAVWDRLLRLPTPFFRDYSAGDLAVRANGINQIRQALSGHVLQTLLAAVFSSFNLVLLFHYSSRLALVALGLVALAMLVTAAAGWLRLRHERHLAQVAGTISGQVFQFLGGIAKLRTTGAETRAFFNWAANYGRQQEHMFRARMVGNALEVFNSLFPVLANMLIFAVIAFWLAGERDFSTGQFLAFNAAFGGFLGAMLAATGTVMAILNVVPVYERARPILQTPPEISAGGAHPGTLSGDIEISHLSFSYSPEGPMILKDVNLHIRPGEFVAVVGASGSGKSTLLRLLLGFEQPTQGAIHYDHQDLSGLDLGALRRQLGVVLQNGQLMSGDIFTNIVGSSPLTQEDAWAAATQAGIAADIRAMPMGMHTVVSDGGGTLSGGQRQRLMIARAIVHRPRILFFDEATSALDNQAQAMVSASLEQLRATRVVIAHRLSTVIHADRILVMAAGEIVESGTYTELIEADGLFADLARRQII